MRKQTLCLAVLLFTACNAKTGGLIPSGTATPTPIPTGIVRSPYRYGVPAPAENPVSVIPQKVTITRAQSDRYVATGLSTFRIMQLTDIHFDDTTTENQKTKQLITQMVSRYQPNLIVVTGDLAWTILGSTENYVKDSTKFLNDLCVAQNTYWAYLIGNHDAWDTGAILWGSGFTRADIAEIVQPYGLDKAGGRMLFNYFENTSKPSESSDRFSLELQDTSGAPLWVNYFLDNTNVGAKSHYMDASVSDADLTWFQDSYAGVKQRSRLADPPAFAFFHIPLEQYESAWNGNEGHGFKYEGVSGQEESIKVMSSLSNNGVVGTFVGHDHFNNFRTRWALSNRNLYMYYGRYSGYGAPDGNAKSIPLGNPDFLPGCMILDMDLAARCWTCWEWDAKLGDSAPRNLDTAEKIDKNTPTPSPSPTE